MIVGNDVTRWRFYLTEESVVTVTKVVNIETESESKTTQECTNIVCVCSTSSWLQLPIFVDISVTQIHESGSELHSNRALLNKNTRSYVLIDEFDETD